MTNKIGPQIACRRRKKTQGRLTATSTPPSKSPTSRKEREKWGTRLWKLLNVFQFSPIAGAANLITLGFLVYTLLAMGRQTRFHMLPEDCRRFVLFLQERDPVIVTKWHSSGLAEIQEVNRPWERGGHYCLWNQAILPALTRKATGKYFNIDFSAPVIEFTYESPVLESWNGQPALTQGRIWASFETENKAFEKWYNAAVRWIRKNFIRDLAVGHGRDSIGPAAYEWFRAGGLLLPNFRPPLTEAWLAWAGVQNQHRTDLAHN